MKVHSTKRFIILASLATALMFAGAGQARARAFEPQHNWWSSGRTCVASRDPPGLAWDELPPRACVEREDVAFPKQPTEEIANVKEPFFVLASIKDAPADKTSKQPNQLLQDVRSFRATSSRRSMRNCA